MLRLLFTCIVLGSLVARYVQKRRAEKRLAETRKLRAQRAKEAGAP